MLDNILLIQNGQNLKHWIIIIIIFKIDLFIIFKKKRYNHFLWKFVELLEQNEVLLVFGFVRFDEFAWFWLMGWFLCSGRDTWMLGGALAPPKF